MEYQVDEPLVLRLLLSHLLCHSPPCGSYFCSCCYWVLVRSILEAAIKVFVVDAVVVVY